MSMDEWHPCMGQEKTARSSLDEQHLLNQIVHNVARDHFNDDTCDISQILSLALMGAGLRHPSDEWCDSTAKAISSGHIVAISTRSKKEPT